MATEGLYAKKFGLREYRIPQEEREILDMWKAQVQQIMDILLIDPFDKETVKSQLNEKGIASRSLDSALLRVESEKYDINKKKLFAIGLWINSVKRRWHWILSIMKVALGGEHKLSQIFKGRERANCIDTAVLTQVMCQEFEIAGEVRTISEKTPHHYFIADTGEVIDVWHSKQRGVLYSDYNDYDEHRDRNFDHPCDR